jgi:hypothetical protein
MSVNSTPSDPIPEYLSRVFAGLKGIEESQRQEIVAEIRSHLADRVQELIGQGSPHPVESALAAMGDAGELAAQFAQEVHRQESSRSYAPWVLLCAAARIAVTGVSGTMVFLVGLVGYATGFGFALVALLKPIMPARVGFWVGPHLFVWGMPGTTMHAHELAGQYFVPVSLVCAFVFASATTLVLQRLMRSTKRMRYILRKR